MKNLLKLLPFIVVAVIFKACTTEPVDASLFSSELETGNLSSQTCTNDLPKTRVINNGSTSFDLEVYDEDGTIVVTELNISPGQTTTWAEFDEGEILFSLSNPSGDTTDDKVKLAMTTCMYYEIIVGANNKILSYTPTTL